MRTFSETEQVLSVTEPQRSGQRDREWDYQRGQADALVRTIQEQMQQFNQSLRALQQDIQLLREGRVTREEFVALSGKVEGLSRWQWMMAGGLGLFMALSQIIPRLLDIGKK